MKRFLFSTTLIFSLHLITPGFAQKPGLPYNRFTGEITQTQVVKTDQSRDKAFSAIKAWISKTYPNYREVVRAEDMSSGRIIIQDREPINSNRFKSFSYRVTIDVKDGHYTCTINNVKTLSLGSAAYASADMDFSNMGMYGQDIDDISRQISITKNKKALAKLYKNRSVLKSLLSDYDKSHYKMSAQFNMIQTGLLEAVSGTSSLAAY
ncbi:DUF4468 domain-containing protein [Dyadobacter fanqingshengii]|uniref:DUF4468 domain-containing protein n=1 Tax=Dyadobacter fanqingshengii TaxID=2906443 RepID=A0A9X1TAB6_9BACT|nr:DUF4468 domain-containing protein [Dyadobacter fanqingshengii]MCF0041283.1 DUF4468 domain-containing protein [Dyadobacter fanqingshengii]USJ36992.1 DUF4468 domain-containing protein [Dyadobacter fanqingshengii]